MNHVNSVNHPKAFQAKNLTCCQRLYFYENLSENDLATFKYEKNGWEKVSSLLFMANMIKTITEVMTQALF